MVNNINNNIQSTKNSQASESSNTESAEKNSGNFMTSFIDSLNSYISDGSGENSSGGKKGGTEEKAIANALSKLFKSTETDNKKEENSLNGLLTNPDGPSLNIFINNNGISAKEAGKNSIADNSKGIQISTEGEIIVADNNIDRVNEQAISNEAQKNETGDSKTAASNLKSAALNSQTAGETEVNKVNTVTTGIKTGETTEKSDAGKIQVNPGIGVSDVKSGADKSDGQLSQNNVKTNKVRINNETVNTDLNKDVAASLNNEKVSEAVNKETVNISVNKNSRLTSQEKTTANNASAKSSTANTQGQVIPADIKAAVDDIDNPEEYIKNIKISATRANSAKETTTEINAGTQIPVKDEAQETNNKQVKNATGQKTSEKSGENNNLLLNNDTQSEDSSQFSDEYSKNSFSKASLNNENSNLSIKNTMASLIENQKAENTGSESKYLNIRTYGPIRMKEIANKTVQAAKDASGSTTYTARLVLTPQSLGTVFVQISMNDNKATFEIKAKTQEVVKSIEAQLGGLKDKLSQQGIQTESIEVRLQSEDENQSGEFMQNKQANEDEQKARKEFVNSFRQLKTEDTNSHGQDENTAAEDISNSSVQYKSQGSTIERYV